MKVNLKRFKIEKAASTNPDRPATAHTFLDASEAMLVATDGRMLAAVPVELALDDATGFIPVEAIQIARHSQRRRDDAEIAANGMVSVAVGDQRAEFERYEIEGGSFPNWLKVVPKGRSPLMSIAVSPDQLKKVGEALGGGAMRLDIFGEDKPIRVVPLGEAGELGARGVISPYVIREDD